MLGLLIGTFASVFLYSWMLSAIGCPVCLALSAYLLALLDVLVFLDALVLAPAPTAGLLVPSSPLPPGSPTSTPGPCAEPDLLVQSLGFGQRAMNLMLPVEPRWKFESTTFRESRVKLSPTEPLLDRRQCSLDIQLANMRVGSSRWPVGGSWREGAESGVC